MPAAVEELARQLATEIAAEYPDLLVEVRGGAVSVRGVLQLVEGQRQIDQYEIEVIVPQRYPKRMPDVYETAGRIPRIADRHMYADGRACLFAPGEQWRHWPRGSNLMDFLDGPVRSFFVNQAIFERTGQWEFGERSHGAMGIIECYRDLIGSKDVRMILCYLEVLSRRKLRPRSPCPCGSGKAINACHMRKLADLRGKVSHRDAAAGLGIVRRELAELKEPRQKSLLP